MPLLRLLFFAPPLIRYAFVMLPPPRLSAFVAAIADADDDDTLRHCRRRHCRYAVAAAAIALVRAYCCFAI